VLAVYLDRETRALFHEQVDPWVPAEEVFRGSMPWSKLAKISL